MSILMILALLSSLPAFALPSSSLSGAEQRTDNQQSAASNALVGVPRIELRFEGNQVFSAEELRRSMRYASDAELITQHQGAPVFYNAKLREDVRRVTFYMRSRGYLQAVAGTPSIEGFAAPADRDAHFWPLPQPLPEIVRISIPIEENRLFHMGEIKITGNTVFTAEEIRRVVGLDQGDIANGEQIGKALFEDLRRLYAARGYVQYEPEIEPEYNDHPRNPREGVANFAITIHEGPCYTLTAIGFRGHSPAAELVLRSHMLLQEGQVFNSPLLAESLRRLNQLGVFEVIDSERDVEYRMQEENSELEIIIKVTEKQP